MRKIFSVLIALLFIGAGCDCSPSIVNSRSSETLGEKDNTSRFNAERNSRSTRRDKNRYLMGYIRDRTVLIQRDCSPKDNTVVITAGDPETVLDGSGSGSIVYSSDNKTTIFTAAHVINIDEKYKKGYTCEITIIPDAELASKTRHVAKILDYDDDLDVAVLTVSENIGPAAEIEFDPFTGEDIWASGYPLQMTGRGIKRLSITKGTLATMFVPVNKSSLKKFGYYHRVTSQVYFGNSGGAVWTKEGKVVAVVVALFAATDQNVPFEGYYYVKPMPEVINMLKNHNKYEEAFGD